MFTGLVERTGRFIKKTSKGQGYIIEIEAEASFNDLVKGESISVNGVCLTLIGFNNKLLSFDVMNETLNKTNLRDYKQGDMVNIERALKVGSRLGGHFVQGHIDETCQIIDIKKELNNYIIKIESSGPETLVVYKGSVAVDGISLTVSNVQNNYFEVSIIPHTLENTNLKTKNKNSVVNIEYDIIGKYVRGVLKKENKGITKERLLELGF